MSIKLQPDRSETWTRRASCYSHQQQWNDAISDYSQAIKIDPKVRTNWHHRGIAYMQLSEWEQAAADFSKVVEGWGEEPDGWYLRATANSRLNKLDFALADLRQAIAKGFIDVEKLRTDPHFDPLTSNSEFTRILTELESHAK
jgi:tetratricopeptide (TPR) repeat protein